jgi:TonB family protein
MRMLIALMVAAVFGAAQDSQIYTAGPGVTLPQATKTVRPQYTSDAMHKKIQGKVGLMVVVQSDGKVGDVQVTESLDPQYGLDEEAVKAVKQWEFEPGKKDGKPVAVRVHMEMTFTLK